MKSRYCPVCGRRYEYHKKTSQFCSAKCRAKAYRDDHPKPLRRSEVIKKRRETKLSKVRLVTCCQCTRSFFVTGLNSNRMYCSNACKQRAYRDRLEFKAQARQQRVEQARRRDALTRLIGALQGETKSQAVALETFDLAASTL